MAQSQLGQTNQSRASFAEARGAVNQSLPKAGHLDQQWNNWLGIQILMREAEKLIGTNQPQR
jgi:hypothetical protein